MPKAAPRLTARMLRTLPLGKWVADGAVLGLYVVRYKTRTTFFLRYKLGRRRRTIVLGELWTFNAALNSPADGVEERPKYDTAETIERIRRGENLDDLVEIVQTKGTPLITLDEAREIAAAIRRQVKLGEDPKAGPKTDFHTVTLEQALEQYLEDKELAEKTATEYRAAIDRYLSDWRDRPLASLTPDEVATRHGEIGRKHGKYAANGVMRVLRAVYTRLRKRHPKMPGNPCDAIEWFKERPRPAAITRETLPTWWAEVLALENGVRRDLYTLMAFTGLRAGSACSIRVEDIDLEAKTLRVPRPKGGEHRAFTLPLSDFLVGVIRRRIVANKARRMRSNRWRERKGKPLLEPSPWLFPAFSTSGHVSEPKPNESDGFSAPWATHDLRKVYMSAAVAAEVQPYAMKLLANHKLPVSDVTARYVNLDVEALRPEQEKITAKLLEWLKPSSRKKLPTPPLALPAPEAA